MLIISSDRMRIWLNCKAGTTQAYKRYVKLCLTPQFQHIRILAVVSRRYARQLLAF